MYRNPHEIRRQPLTVLYQIRLMVCEHIEKKCCNHELVGARRCVHSARWLFFVSSFLFKTFFFRKTIKLARWLPKYEPLVRGTNTSLCPPLSAYHVRPRDLKSTKISKGKPCVVKKTSPQGFGYAHNMERGNSRPPVALIVPVAVKYSQLKYLNYGN